MASSKPAISSLFDTLDLIATGGDKEQGKARSLWASGGSSGEGAKGQSQSSLESTEADPALAEHRSASALLLAKRKEDSHSRNTIKVLGRQTQTSAVEGTLKSSVIFEHVSTSSVDTPKYWGGSAKGSGNKKAQGVKAKVTHQPKPRSKAHMKKREKGERYSEKKAWKNITGKRGER